MPNENSTTPEAAPSGLSGQGAPAATPGAEPAAVSPAAEAAAKATAEPAAAELDSFTMTRSVWKKQIAEKQAAARNELAVGLGYKDEADMTRALARLAAAQAAPAAAKPAAEPAAPAADPTLPVAGESAAQAAALAPLRAKLRQEIAAGRGAKREAQAAKREIEQLKARYEAQEAAYQLREVVRSRGVVGDYADDVMARLQKKIDGMSEDEIATFNEEEWIDSLKTKHPFYFGESTVPANAGNADRIQPPKAAPSEATKNAQSGAAFDGMKASKAEVEKRIRDLGIPAPKFNN